MENSVRKLNRFVDKRVFRAVFICADLHIVGTFFAALVVRGATGVFPSVLDAPLIELSLALFSFRVLTKVLAWAVCSVRIEGGEDRIRAHVIEEMDVSP